MATQQNNTTREQLENAIMEFAPMITLDSGISFDDVRRTIRVFMRHHPEIFWFSHQYRYDEKTGVLRFKYNFTKEKAYFFKGEIEKVVKDDFQIDYAKSLSEIERLVYIYKWIANRTTYNEYSSFNQTIYSVMVKNRIKPYVHHRSWGKWLGIAVGLCAIITIGLVLWQNKKSSDEIAEIESLKQAITFQDNSISWPEGISKEKFTLYFKSYDNE